MTYGRAMKKAMATFDINPQNWYELRACCWSRKVARNDQM